MAQRTSRTNGTRPFQAAVDRIEKEFGSLQKQLRSQGRTLEKRIEKGRREIASRGRRIETRGRKQVKSLLSDVRKTDAYKRARSLRKDAEKRLESGVESVLATLQIASKSDLQRIDRKLRKLNKKLDEIEKARPARSGSQERSAAHA